MDNEIKKDITSNWFKLLQNAICDDIVKLEKNKINRITISEIAQRKFSLDEMCSKIELLVSSS